MMESPTRIAIPVAVFTGRYLLRADVIDTTTGAICPPNAPNTISGRRNSSPPIAVVLRELIKRFEFLTIMRQSWVYWGSDAKRIICARVIVRPLDLCCSLYRFSSGELLSVWILPWRRSLLPEMAANSETDSIVSRSRM